jgi:dTDP-4-amino-4,6-dideoxygalactose transaminase
MPKITFSDPKAAYSAHKKEIDAAIQRVLESGKYILGSEVDSFEREFAQYLGAKYTIGVASGTDAITLALKSLGVGPGCYVFTVSHTAVATAVGIVQSGAVPVFVDVDPVTMTMDPARLEAMARSMRGSAVVAVHLYGKCADVTALRHICDRHGLFLILDAAQAVAPWSTQCADATTFSFYPTKNLSGIGDGGAVAFNEAIHSHTCAMLREYGWINRNVASAGGINSRLDELQAAILRAKLPFVEVETQTRRANAWRLGSSVPQHVYHLLVKRFKDRSKVRARFAALGIDTGVHYPQPIHKQNYFGAYPRGPMDVTEELAAEVLTLPVHENLTEEDISWVQKIYSQLS